MISQICVLPTTHRPNGTRRPAIGHKTRPTTYFFKGTNKGKVGNGGLDFI